MGRNNCSWKLDNNCNNPECMDLGLKCVWKYGPSCGHYSGGGEIYMAEKKGVEIKLQGYCMHCKVKRDMVDVKVVTMKNTRRAAKGTCIICKTKMFKILGKGEVK